MCPCTLEFFLRICYTITVGNKFRLFFVAKMKNGRAYPHKKEEKLFGGISVMTISQDVAQMFCVAKGAGVARHENAAIPEEGKWVHAKEIKDISGFTHGIGWCAPQQGA